MHLLTSILSFALACLIMAQTNISNSPLMNDYHGLIVVIFGLFIICAMNLCAYLNTRLAEVA